MNRLFNPFSKLRSQVFSLAVFISLAFLINSCEKDKPLPQPVIEETDGFIELEFIGKMNGLPLQGYTVFENANGQRSTIENFKFYLGEISLRNEQNEVVKLRDVAFFDMLNGKNSMRVKLPQGIYSHLNYHVGVPDEMNGTNNPTFSAAVYEQEHPLSIFNGMYWTWATGYIFLKIEGKIDTSSAQNQTPLRNYFYHVGMQEFYELKDFPGSTFEIKAGETTKVRISMEYNDFFRNDNETIDMAVQSFTHTTDNIQLARKIFSNFLQSMELAP
ncbi:MAG: MbnP family protein [Flavobacteriales bacterium]